MFEKMVPVAEFENEIEAEIACGHLKSQGIDAIVLKDDAGGMFPSLQETEGVHLLAPQEQVEMARRVLDEWKTREAK